MRVWVGVAVATVLLASACGSGNGSGTTSGSHRLSRFEYRAKLKTIAKESDKAQHDLAVAFGTKKSEELAKVLSTFAAAEKRIGDEVAALKPPTEAERANTELAKGLHDTASEVRAVLPKIEKLPSAKAGIAYLHKQPPTLGGREVDAALANLKQLGLLSSLS